MSHKRDGAAGGTAEFSAGARSSRLRAMIGVSLAMLLAVGCSATTLKHGHQFQETDLQQVQPGMTEDSVRMALGTPATTSALPGGNAYYYISSTTQQTAFLQEKEVDRKVVAVYFNPTGSVEKVAHYGMRDGRVFDFVKKETPAHMRDKSFVSRFFRGVGSKQKILDD